MSDHYAHVHARIAEHVSRDLGVSLDAEDVRQILLHGTSDTADQITIDAVFAEAREYGITDRDH